MTLYSIDGNKEQSPIGKRDHWDLFRRFQGKPLHEAIVAAISSSIGAEAIDSSQAGSTILTDLERRHPDILASCPSELLGNLFGMILWNYLAERPDDWTFVVQTTGLSEFPHMLYWRLS